VQSVGLLEDGGGEEFGAALHGFGEGHVGRFDGAEEVKAGAELVFGFDGSGEGGDGLSERAGEVGDAHGAFTMERLRVEAAFAGDDEVGGGDAIAQVNEFSDEIESTGESGPAEAHEAEAEAAGGARAGDFMVIDAQIALHDVSEPL
jgi:hypothetical protein